MRASRAGSRSPPDSCSAETARGEPKGKLSSARCLPSAGRRAGLVSLRWGGELGRRLGAPSPGVRPKRKRDGARLAGESRQSLSGWGGFWRQRRLRDWRGEGKLGCGSGLGSRASQVNLWDQCRWRLTFTTALVLLGKTRCVIRSQQRGQTPEPGD